MSLRRCSDSWCGQEHVAVKEVCTDSVDSSIRDSLSARISVHTSFQQCSFSFLSTVCLRVYYLLKRILSIRSQNIYSPFDARPRKIRFPRGSLGVYCTLCEQVFVTQRWTLFFFFCVRVLARSDYVNLVCLFQLHKRSFVGTCKNQFKNKKKEMSRWEYCGVRRVGPDTTDKKKVQISLQKRCVFTVQAPYTSH